MSSRKPFNDYPVELTLSVESVSKINLALEVVTAQANNYLQLVNANLRSPNDQANAYTNTVVTKAIIADIEYLTDLKVRRMLGLSMMLDNVADSYADKVDQQDKEMQAAMRAATSHVAKAVP